ncbi:hypothetical protein SAMN05444584_2209 [Acinetobacter apis]|uniref:Uncharacterized protein n=1 Tax=Acinetobacter apis TaxID=1229165 RepID=A0A217EIA0_9GAMM|nr:hypothetical protein SAMN05444584_2209 [Acinetobacter apis]
MVVMHIVKQKNPLYQPDCRTAVRLIHCITMHTINV